MSWWCFKGLICSLNYSIKLGTNEKIHFASKGRIVPWLYFDLRHLAIMKALHHTTTVLQHPWLRSDERDMVWHISWGCLIRLALTGWDFALWSPAALSVLTPHSHLCQPAEKPSVTLSVLLILIALRVASSWALATLCEEQTSPSLTSHKQQTKPNSTNTHSQY